MMTTRLQLITLHYWEVSKAINVVGQPIITMEQAFKKLNHMDRLLPTEWRLIDLMHILKYDLIEGNTEWRAKKEETSSASIHLMSNWTSTRAPMENPQAQITKT